MSEYKVGTCPQCGSTDFHTSSDDCLAWCLSKLDEAQKQARAEIAEQMRQRKRRAEVEQELFAVQHRLDAVLRVARQQLGHDECKTYEKVVLANIEKAAAVVEKQPFIVSENTDAYGKP